MLRAILVLIALGAAAPAWADWTDPDVEGAKEHPLVSFYPEARVDQYRERRFDAIEIVTGFDAAASPPAIIEEIEGRITEYVFQHKPEVSALEVARNFEAALKKKGATVIVFAKGETLGEVDGIGVDHRFAAYRMEEGGKTTAYINVNAMPGSDMTWTTVTVVEPRGMEQVYEITAASLYDDLAKSGRVTVHGITFETGKTTILPQSEKVLAEVGELLTEHEDLRLAIEGHTDNVGTPDSNQKLSEGRAAEVKAWLVANGVASDRLTTTGYGDSQPVADNDTEEGRAKNRRVDIVQQ